MSHFTTSGVIKTVKLLGFFKKRQVDEFIRVKTFLTKNILNKKVTFIVFHLKDINKLVP